MHSILLMVIGSMKRKPVRRMNTLKRFSPESKVLPDTRVTRPQLKATDSMRAPWPWEADLGCLYRGTSAPEADTGTPSLAAGSPEINSIDAGGFVPAACAPAEERDQEEERSTQGTFEVLHTIPRLTPCLSRTPGCERMLS